MNRPTLSVIIATYNSERTLGDALSSLDVQQFSRVQREIIVIDGGSTDATVSIAKKYHCRVINNPKRVPAWAKYLGYIAAKGKYLMYLDSDEVIVNKDSLKRKLALFQANPEVRAVTGSGYRNPPGYSILNRYINEFGDPFSFFIYRLSKDERFFIPSMKRAYHVEQESQNDIVFTFDNSQQLPIFELVAMGSIVDLDYLRQQFPQIKRTPDLIPHLFYLLVSLGAEVAIIKNDPLLHYSATSRSGYLKKIRARIINNVFTPAKEGFLGRNTMSRGWAYKKYLFVPYALTLLFPLFDALYLSVTRRNVSYFVHVPLTLYTALSILYYTCMREIGMRYETQRYG